MADRGVDLEDESIGGLFGRLVEDGREFVRAEIAAQCATVAERIAEARVAIVLGAVAFLLVTSSLVGLMVGCVIALSRWLGPVGAGLVVTCVTLAVAGLLGWLAARQFSAPHPGTKDGR